MGTYLKVVPTSFTRKQNHELTKVLKLLTQESASAVAALIELLHDKDPKIKLAAASKIIEHQESIAMQINNDQMQRLVANAKFGNALGGGTDIDDDTPSIDFNSIQTD